MRKVIKVGSSSLVGENGPNFDVFDSLASEICTGIEQGNEFAIVTSGAIALGAFTLGRPINRESIHEQQMLAAFGQPLLQQLWRDAFSSYGVKTAQVLVTHRELSERANGEGAYARGVLDILLSCGFVPIINENDSVAVDEIKVGDNDQISALVAKAVGADSLHILGTATALFRDYPNNQDRVEHIAYTELNNFVQFCEGTEDPQAIGGMMTKIEAAKIFGSMGAVYIASAGEREAIKKSEQGEIGTKIA